MCLGSHLCHSLELWDLMLEKAIVYKNRIDYNSYVDNVEYDLMDEEYSYNDNDNIDTKVNSSADNLVDRYKDELSWFYQ